MSKRANTPLSVVNTDAVTSKNVLIGWTTLANFLTARVYFCGDESDRYATTPLQPVACPREIHPPRYRLLSIVAISSGTQSTGSSSRFAAVAGTQTKYTAMEKTTSISDLMGQIWELAGNNILIPCTSIVR